MPRINVSELSLSDEQINILRRLLEDDRRIPSNPWAMEPEIPVSMQQLVSRAGVTIKHWVVREDNPVQSWGEVGLFTVQVYIKSSRQQRIFLFPSASEPTSDNLMVLMRDAYRGPTALSHRNRGNQTASEYCMREFRSAILESVIRETGERKFLNAI